MDSNNTLITEDLSESHSPEVSNMVTVTLLKTKGWIPADSQKMNSKGLAKCKCLSDFKKLTLEEKLNLREIPVICDNPVWACQDSVGFWSYDENGFLWRTAKKNRMITKYFINLKDDSGLQAVEPISLIKNKEIIEEGFKMPDQNKNVDFKDELKDLVGEIESEGEITTTPTGTTSFTEGGKTTTPKTDAEKEKEKQEKTARHNNLISVITQNTANVELADSTELTTFNRNYGSLVGYITAAESKIMASAPKRPIMVDGKAQLTAEGKKDAVINAQHTAGKKVPQSYYLKQPKLVLKEAAPTSHQGTIIEMPAGGAVSDSSFFQAGEIKFDAARRDLVLVVDDKDTMAYFIMNYFGGLINENKATHGELAGELKVSLEAAVSKKDSSTKSKIVHKSITRKRIITDTNYIPRKVYQTVTLSELVNKATDAQRVEANRSLFHKFFDVKDAGILYNDLDNVSKPLISMDKESKQIASVFIAPNGKPMSVSKFFDAAKQIANPEIPLKIFKNKTTGEGQSASYITYDVLNPNKDLETLNPQTNPKFSVMVKALNGRLTVAECIKKCIKAKDSTNPTSQRKELSNDEARKVLFNTIQGATANIKVDVKLDKKSSESLKKQVAEIKFSKEA